MLLGLPSPDELVVGTLRLPRLVTGLLVGAAFGVSGALIQTMARNPLASPDVIGVTHGAGAATVAAMTFGLTSYTALTYVSVGGGLATALLVYLFAWRGGLAPLPVRAGRHRHLGGPRLADPAVRDPGRLPGRPAGQGLAHRIPQRARVRPCRAARDRAPAAGPVPAVGRAGPARRGLRRRHGHRPRRPARPHPARSERPRCRPRLRRDRRRGSRRLRGPARPPDRPPAHPHPAHPAAVLRTDRRADRGGGRPAGPQAPVPDGAAGRRVHRPGGRPVPDVVDRPHPKQPFREEPRDRRPPHRPGTHPRVREPYGRRGPGPAHPGRQGHRHRRPERLRQVHPAARPGPAAEAAARCRAAGRHRAGRACPPGGSPR